MNCSKRTASSIVFFNTTATSRTKGLFSASWIWLKRMRCTRWNKLLFGDTIILISRPMTNAEITSKEALSRWFSPKRLLCVSLQIKSACRSKKCLNMFAISRASLSRISGRSSYAISFSKTMEGSDAILNRWPVTRLKDSVP